MRNFAELQTRFETLLAQTDNGKPFVSRQEGVVSLYLNGSGVQSTMRQEVPDELVLGYTQTMMGFLLFYPAPERIVMVGLGGGSLAKYCYRYLPESRFVVIENDAQVVELRDHFHVPKDDQRFQVILGDGAEFLKNPPDKYDILLIDGFDYIGQPAQLCSRSFYDDCYQALSADGIMVVNLLRADPGKLASIERIRQSFGGAAIVVNAIDSTNQIVFACKGVALDLPDYVLRGRLNSLSCDHSVKLDQTVQRILLARRLDMVATMNHRSGKYGQSVKPD